MSNKEETLYLSQNEYEKKRERIDSLRTELSKISKEKADAANNDPGNTWHDNFAFEQLEQQENFLYDQINSSLRELENVSIIEKGKVKPECVDIHDRVKLQFLYDDGEVEEMSLTLCGINEEESISLNSSLGQAVYGKKYGSTVEYDINGKTIRVSIVEKL